MVHNPSGKRVQMVYWTKRAIRKYGVFADGSVLPFRDTWFWARNGVSLHGKTSVSQNLLAIQTFGREKVCRGKKNSSMHENPFAIQVFLPKRVCRCKGKALFRKTRSRYRLLDGKWCVAARKTVQCTKTRSRLVNGDRMRVGGQLRFHGCDFLLSLRPFFGKLRSVV